ncbi:MAG: 50S ribosomal protein L9 [Myxococcota bacterium]|nr:50S ribosomal protein L9 [Myxococcota bacterium]MEC9389724.1 50S ribosomal protein L9 [Myxococcota bacterium]
MLVILQQNVPNLGNVGDIVKVKDGYGRNFLVPRGMAVIADQGNRRRMEHQKRTAAAQRAAAMAEAEALLAKIAETPITIAVSAGEEGKLFGSVTNRDIADKLAEAGVEVDRRSISINDAIKETGAYDVTVKLGLELTATLKVYVVGE